MVKEARVAEKVENRQILTRVPAERVEKVVAQFRAEGAESVITREEPEGGTYTIEAIFPEILS